MELEAALGHTVLTLTEAAATSGYSADHLGHLVREGKIPNAGRPGAPRIALRDLPRKAPESAADPEPEEEPLPGKVSSTQGVLSLPEEGA